MRRKVQRFPERTSAVAPLPPDCSGRLTATERLPVEQASAVPRRLLTVKRRPRPPWHPATSSPSPAPKPLLRLAFGVACCNAGSKVGKISKHLVDFCLNMAFNLSNAPRHPLPGRGVEMKMASAYDNWLEGDCGVNDAAVARYEAVEAKIEELRADPKAMAAADARLSGDLPEAAYEGIEGWLATIGDMLPPSGRVYADDLGKLPQHVIAKLADAARIASGARMTALRDIAEAQIKREEEESWKAYGELLAERAA